MNEQFLIRNTTPEQREQIVLEALSGGDECERPVTDADLKLYQPYIDGEMELKECTAAWRASYLRGYMDRTEDTGCGFAR